MMMDHSLIMQTPYRKFLNELRASWEPRRIPDVSLTVYQSLVANLNISGVADPYVYTLMRDLIRPTISMI